jgi:subfamily B ATP-binding cassette protein MsbA
LTKRPKRHVLRRGRTALRIMSVPTSRIFLLVGLSVTLAVLQGLAVGMLSPVLQYIEFGSVKSSGPYGTMLLDVSHLLGLQVGLLTLLVLAFVPVIFREVVYFINNWATSRVVQGAAIRMRTRGFSALVDGDLAFVVGQGFGNLVSTLTLQAQRGSQAVGQFLTQISTGLLIAMYVIVLLTLDWRLGLMAVVAMMFMSFLVRGAVTRSRALGAETTRRNNETYSVIGERITAIRLIKMLGQERAETRKVTRVVQHLADAQVRIAIFSGVIEVTLDPLNMLVVFAIIYVGVQYFHASLATLGIFLFILLQLSQLAKNFNGGRQTLVSLIDSLISVRDMINKATASLRIVGGSTKFEGVRESIRLESVSFAYGDEKEHLVLKGVDLEIPSRSQTAIVGRSGGGKSTLVDLIPRLREATSGEILFDGRRIQDFELRSLRRSIGFMTQDALLFDDTIRVNLGYGLDREPSSEEIDAALKASYCSTFVADLPSGLDTRVGDRGVRLSGGQRQRLALARVFLQDPDILILDEPTSALDSESEEYIQKALESMRHRKTLIVIAHRLSTVSHSDQIVVLDHGVIVERGVHEELLDAEGAYHRLFDLQIYR